MTRIGIAFQCFHFLKYESSKPVNSVTKNQICPLGISSNKSSFIQSQKRRIDQSLKYSNITNNMVPFPIVKTPIQSQSSTQATAELQSGTLFQSNSNKQFQNTQPNPIVQSTLTNELPPGIQVSLQNKLQSSIQNSSAPTKLKLPVIKSRPIIQIKRINSLRQSVYCINSI